MVARKQLMCLWGHETLHVNIGNLYFSSIHIVQAVQVFLCSRDTGNTLGLDHNPLLEVYVLIIPCLLYLRTTKSLVAKSLHKNLKEKFCLYISVSLSVFTSLISVALNICVNIPVYLCIFDLYLCIFDVYLCIFHFISLFLYIRFCISVSKCVTLIHKGCDYSDDQKRLKGISVSD